MVDILCIGEVVIDFTPGQEKASYICHAGGAPANVAISFNRMGGSSAFCGKVGDDLFGEYLLGVLRDNNVQLWGTEPTKDAVTTMTFVTLTSDGNRSFTFAQKQGAHLFLEKTDITPDMIQSVKLVHTGSSILTGGTAPEAILYALNMAKENNILVSFDLNYRALQWNNPEDCYNQVIKLLPYIDFLKISNEESFLFGGDGMLPQIIDRFDIPLVVLTRGAGISSVFWNKQEWQQPSLGKTAVDTTGAGDAFWGAFLYVLISDGVWGKEDLNETRIIKALKYGVTAGELAVLRKGAIASLPTKVEVEEALKFYD